MKADREPSKGNASPLSLSTLCIGLVVGICVAWAGCDDTRIGAPPEYRLRMAAIMADGGADGGADAGGGGLCGRFTLCTSNADCVNNPDGPVCTPCPACGRHCWNGNGSIPTDAGCVTPTQIGNQCPVGNITYTPGGDGGSGTFFQADAGRFICGDFSNLLRACMNNSFPGTSNYYVTGTCIAPDGGRSAHAIVMYHETCSNQFCLLNPYQMKPDAGGQQACCFPVPADMSQPLRIPAQCTDPSGYNAFLCQPGSTVPDSSQFITGAPNYCSYSSGNWTCCDDTVCRVCSEFGQDPTVFYP